MYLDVRTVTLVGMATAMLFSVLGVMVAASRQTCPGFRYWTLANLCSSLALLLIGLRGIIPDPVAILGGDSLAITAAALILEGARRFRGKTRFWWPSPAAGFLTLTLLCYNKFVVDNLNNRIALLSLYLGVFGVLIAKQLFLVIRPGYRLSLGFATSVMALFSITQFARAIYTTSMPPIAKFFSPSPAFAFLMVGTVLGIIAWSVSYFLINNDHLVEHLKQARTRAAEADAIKSQFLANASHEIRTPMNGVIGLTELLLDTPLNLTQRDYVETLRESGIALLEIIDDLLDLSKIEAGKLELVEEAFDPREIVERTVDLLGWKALAKGLKLNWEVDPDVPVDLLGDAVRLQQVLTNLTGNAIKFTTCGEVAIHVGADDAVLRFSVTDNGPGIAKGEQTRLFERFEQMKTGHRDGTGLGLAIAKDLAQRMGGRVGIISEAGHGSTFWFTATLKRNTALNEALIDLNSPIMHG
jgi:signal transduction histidine kinase